jgi:type IV pilus assembly protein PilA
MKRRWQFRLSVIEVAIVVSVCGVLAAVAVPGYASFSKRARVAEGLDMASAAMRLVEANAAKGHTVFNLGWNVTQADTLEKALCDGLSGACIFGHAKMPLSSNVRSISVTGVNGMVTVTYQARAAESAGQTLLLWPSIAEGPLVVGAPIQEKITWTCFSAGKPISKGLPADVAPTLPEGLVPEQCR